MTTPHTVPAARPPGDAATYDPPALLRRVLRRWWLLVVVAVLAAVIGLLWSSASDSVYEAEAQVQLSAGVTGIVLGANLVPQSDDRRVATESEILSSDRVRAEAEDTSGGELPDLVVSSSAGSDILTATVRDGDAARAAAAADAYVDAYLDISAQRVSEQLQPAVAVAQQDLDRTEAAIVEVQRQMSTPKVARDVTGVRADALQSRLASLLTQRVADTETTERLDSAVSLGSLDVRRLSSAQTPDHRVSPQPARVALVTGALALALAAIAAAAWPDRSPAGASSSRRWRRRRSTKAPA